MTIDPCHQNIQTHSPLKLGLWFENVALVQLLGLCPLLAISTNAVNALGLGLATIFVLTLSNTIIALIAPLVRREIRIPVYVVVIAASVTAIELLINAFFHPLYLVLGLFLPLIVTNCAVLGRAEAFAARNSIAVSALDGFTTGLGFALVLFLLGAVREVIGQGSLFAQSAQLLGPWASVLELHFFAESKGLLLAILPPGAFFILAGFIALKNKIDAKRLQENFVKAAQLAQADVLTMSPPTSRLKSDRNSK